VSHNDYIFSRVTFIAWLSWSTHGDEASSLSAPVGTLWMPFGAFKLTFAPESLPKLIPDPAKTVSMFFATHFGVKQEPRVLTLGAIWRTMGAILCTSGAIRRQNVRFSDLRREERCFEHNNLSEKHTLTIYIYIISSSYYIYNISLDLYDFLHILQVIPLAKCYGIYSTFGEILRGTPLDVIKFQCDSHILQGGTPCPMWENPFLGIQWHPKGHPLGSPWISMNCIQFTDGTPCNT